MVAGASGRCPHPINCWETERGESWRSAYFLHCIQPRTAAQRTLLLRVREALPASDNLETPLLLIALGLIIFDVNFVLH